MDAASLFADDPDDLQPLHSTGMSLSFLQPPSPQDLSPPTPGRDAPLSGVASLFPDEPSSCSPPPPPPPSSSISLGPPSQIRSPSSSSPGLLSLPSRPHSNPDPIPSDLSSSILPEDLSSILPEDPSLEPSPFSSPPLSPPPSSLHPHPHSHPHPSSSPSPCSVPSDDAQPTDTGCFLVVPSPAAPLPPSAPSPSPATPDCEIDEAAVSSDGSSTFSPPASGLPEAAVESVRVSEEASSDVDVPHFSAAQPFWVPDVEGCSSPAPASDGTPLSDDELIAHSDGGHYVDETIEQPILGVGEESNLDDEPLIPDAEEIPIPVAEELVADGANNEPTVEEDQPILQVDEPILPVEDPTFAVEEPTLAANELFAAIVEEPIHAADALAPFVDEEVSSAASDGHTISWHDEVPPLSFSGDVSSHQQIAFPPLWNGEMPVDSQPPAFSFFPVAPLSAADGQVTTRLTDASAPPQSPPAWGTAESYDTPFCYDTPIRQEPFENVSSSVAFHSPGHFGQPHSDPAAQACSHDDESGASSFFGEHPRDEPAASQLFGEHPHEDDLFGSPSATGGYTSSGHDPSSGASMAEPAGGLSLLSPSHPSLTSRLPPHDEQHRVAYQSLAPFAASYPLAQSIGDSSIPAANTPLLDSASLEQSPPSAIQDAHLFSSSPSLSPIPSPDSHHFFQAPPVPHDLYPALYIRHEHHEHRQNHEHHHHSSGLALGDASTPLHPGYHCEPASGHFQADLAPPVSDVSALFEGDDSGDFPCFGAPPPTSNFPQSQQHPACTAPIAFSPPAHAYNTGTPAGYSSDPSLPPIVVAAHQPIALVPQPTHQPPAPAHRPPTATSDVWWSSIRTPETWQDSQDPNAIDWGAPSLPVPHPSSWPPVPAPAKPQPPAYSTAAHISFEPQVQHQHSAPVEPIPVEPVHWGAVQPPASFSLASQPLNHPLQPRSQPWQAEQPGRELKFTRPHAVAAFGLGGRLFSFGQNFGPRLFRVDRLLSRGPAAGLVKACQAYPGPLEASTSPASVLGFLNQMAQSPSLFDSASASPHTQVILSVLRVLVQAKGKSHTESKTTLSELIDCILPHDLSATTAAAAAPHAESQRLAAVEKLMLKGQVKEALEAACSAHLWPYALLISSQLGETAFKTTMGRFASEYVPAGSPLKPVFSLMAGQAQELFNQLLPSSASQEQRAMVLDNWRQNVCGILSSRVEGNRRIIGQLGDQLWATRRDNVAAHVCYLLAEHPFQELHAKGARLVLLGGDHKLHRSSFFASPEALYRSEIFEYAKKLANGSFVLPSIQTYRLQYAGLLTDLGFPSRALKYVKAVQTVVDRDRAAFSPILLYHLDLFAARLSSVTTASDDSAESDESASASKLGRVSEFFTSMLSGLVSSQPATAPETAAIESSPFITPPKPKPMVGPPPVSFSNPDSLQAPSPGLSPQPSPGLPSEFASSPFMSQPTPPPMDHFSSPFVQPNYNQTIQHPHQEHPEHQHHQQQQQQQQHHQHRHQESPHQPISWEPSGLTQPVAGPISWGDPTSSAAPQHRTTDTPHLAGEPFSWAPTTAPSPVVAPTAEPIAWGTPATQQQHSSASISWASESKAPMPWSSGPVAGPAVPPAHSFAPPPNFQFTPASTTTAPPPLEDRRPSGAAGFSFKPSGNYEQEQQAPSIPTSPFAFSPAPSPSAAENELLRSVSMPQIPSKPAAETKATKTPDPASNPAAAAGGADGGAPGQSGLFGKLFGFLKRPAKEVHLDCNKPVFDEVKGKWVLPGDTEEETAPPPPPPSDNMLGPAIPAHQPPPGCLLPSSPSPGMLPPPSISTPSLLSQSGGESSDSDVSRRGPRRRGYVDTLAGGQLRQSFGSMSSLTADNRPPPPAGFTIFNAAPADPAAEQPPCEST